MTAPTRRTAAGTPAPLKKHLFYPLFLFLLAACSPDQPAQRHAPPAAALPLPAKLPAPPAAAPDTLTLYEWDSDACHFTGYFNARQYSKAQLDNTWELLFGSAALATDATPFQPADIEKLSLDTLKAEYTRRIAHYRAMRVVPRPQWLKLKKLKIQEMEDDYRAKKLTIAAFANPAVLLATAYAGDCKKYARGLAAQNDSLILQDWKRLAEERKQLNGIPEAYLAQFNAQYQSDDRLLYAKIDLLTYGWWNCANNSIRRVEVTEKMYSQFEKLFVNIASECDDVD